MEIHAGPAISNAVTRVTTTAGVRGRRCAGSSSCTLRSTRQSHVVPVKHGFPLQYGKRCRTCPLKANSDFDSQEVAEGQGIEVTEDAWRKRVREKVAKEIAEEKMMRDEQPPGQGGVEMSAELASAPEDKMFGAVVGSAAVLAVATTVTLLTNAFGVDVFSRLHVPEDPQSFAQTCAAWTLPAVVGTAFMWNNIFFSKEGSDLRDIFRSEAWEARDVVQGETVASMALSGALLAIAEGIVFRGTGLALSADFFAGISSFPIADPQQASADLLHLQIFPEYHLPVSWVWPSVVLGASALEATVEAMSQGGVDPLDRKVMTEMLCTSIMTETMEVQYATAERTGSVELQKGGKNVKLCEVSASGLARVVGDFHGQFQQQLQRQGHMYAGPGLILAKAAFLSAEAVLTDSLLAALVTGAACEAVQSIISLDYIEKRAKETQA